VRSTSWPPWHVVSLRRNLKELVDLVSEVEKQSREIEHLAWLARLLVVRSSGYIEQSVGELARAYVQEKSGGLVRAFAHSWLERTQNPSPEALISLMGRFDSSLENDLVAFLDNDDQKYRRELAFMVDRRNRIAHGLNESVGARRAVALADVATEITDWFVLRLNPFR
jgi:hypothetical protein